ncbi:MAG: hypothetical protein JWL85_771 [Candidatus Saccharibacteria bacterium]|nr:hypothetical protein [Candidatus Saccharibacteria bacterium]
MGHSFGGEQLPEPFSANYAAIETTLVAASNRLEVRSLLQAKQNFGSVRIEDPGSEWTHLTIRQIPFQQSKNGEVIIIQANLRDRSEGTLRHYEIYRTDDGGLGMEDYNPGDYLAEVRSDAGGQSSYTSEQTGVKRRAIRDRHLGKNRTSMDTAQRLTAALTEKPATESRLVRWLGWLGRNGATPI